MRNRSPRNGSPTPFTVNLRALLRERGLTQKRVASETGIASSTLGDWIAGVNPYDLVAIQRLCHFLKCDFEWLLTGAHSETLVSPIPKAVWQHYDAIVELLDRHPVFKSALRLREAYLKWIETRLRKKTDSKHDTTGLALDRITELVADLSEVLSAAEFQLLLAHTSELHVLMSQDLGN